MFESLEKREVFDSQGFAALPGAENALFYEDFSATVAEQSTLDRGWYGSGLAIEENAVLGGSAINGQNKLGSTAIAHSYHGVAIDNSLRFLVMSFDAYADWSAKSHNSGVGLNDLGTGSNWFYSRWADGWLFDARGITGDSTATFTVNGGADTEVELHIVVDFDAETVYGVADYGEGQVTTTPTYQVNETRLDTLRRVFVFQDFRHEGWSGIDVGQVTVWQSDVDPTADGLAALPGAENALFYEDFSTTVAEQST